MTEEQLLSRPIDPRMTRPSGAELSRRRAAVSASDRLVRQIQNTDAWITARREREQALNAPGLSRNQRMEADRELEVLRRTHDAIKGRCARGLANQVEWMRPPGPTAVIAHRHAWFVDRLVQLLGRYGVTVLECTDNGAQALGAVIAEQPDVLLVGDGLAMMPGRALLAQARLHAENTLLAAKAMDQEQTTYEALADAVFLRRHPPGDIAEALVAMHLTAAGDLECG